MDKVCKIGNGGCGAVGWSKTSDREKLHLIFCTPTSTLTRLIHIEESQTGPLGKGGYA